MPIEMVEDVIASWPTTPQQVRLCCLRLVAMCAQANEGIAISDAVKSAATFERFINEGAVLSQDQVMKLVVGK